MSSQNQAKEKNSTPAENKSVKTEGGGHQSTVLQKSAEKPEEGQFSMPTWGLIFVLILAFVILKSFIYIKDEKRYGK